jgi:hypothetical protein
VDYITKPLDPWVLRAKVAVFVDLWTLHANLAERAQECDELRSAIDDTLGLLDGLDVGVGPDGGEQADALETARRRLRSVRGRAVR